MEIPAKSSDWNYVKISNGGKRIFQQDIVEIKDNGHSYLFTIREGGKNKIFSFLKEHVNFMKD
jgi:hypothetical protein